MERLRLLIDKLGWGESERRWRYDYFREYLLSLTRGWEFYLPQGHYSNRIELGRGWHATLNEMRVETDDGKERYAIAGFKEDRRAVYLPFVPHIGLDGLVPSEVIFEARRKASVDYKIPYFMGDLHSHPSTFQFDSDLSFSVGDFYHLVGNSVVLPFMGVVGKRENLFVFVTRENLEARNVMRFLDPDMFVDFWYQRNGFKYLGVSEQLGEMAVPVRTGARFRDVALDILNSHRLVLYKGRPSGDLVRAFP